MRSTADIEIFCAGDRCAWQMYEDEYGCAVPTIGGQLIEMKKKGIPITTLLNEPIAIHTPNGSLDVCAEVGITGVVDVSVD